MREQTRHAIGLVIGSGLSAVFTLVYLTVTGRNLGPAEYSNFAAALAVIYFGTVALGPLGPTVARFAAIFAARHDQDAIVVLRTRIRRKLGLVGLFGLLVLLAALPAMSRLLNVPRASLVFATVIIFLFLLVTIDRATMQGQHRFHAYNVNSVLESLLRMVLGVVLVSIFPLSLAALSAYAVALGVALFAAAIILRRPEPAVRTIRLDWGQLARFSGQMLALAIALAAYQNFDMLLIKRWFAPSEAGAYGAATALAKTIAVIVGPFYVLSMPMLTWTLEREENIRTVTLQLCLQFFLLSLIPLSIFMFLSDALVELLYGSAYRAGSELIFPLSVALTVGYLSLLLAQALAAMEKFRFLYLYCAGVVLLLGLLVWRHGTMVEVAWTLVWSQVITLGFMSGLFWRESRKYETELSARQPNLER